MSEQLLRGRTRCPICDGTGFESQPITNSASPEPGVACENCDGHGVIEIRGVMDSFGPAWESDE